VAAATSVAVCAVLACVDVVDGELADPAARYQAPTSFYGEWVFSFSEVFFQQTFLERP
jgi:hypothetical protein